MLGLESPAHLLIILVIVLIVFGPGRLPEVGASLGRAIRSFREAVSPRDPAEPPGKEPSGPPARTPPRTG